MTKTSPTATAAASDRDEQARTAEIVDNMLDIALDGTFPASDPVAISSVANTPTRPR